MFSTGLLAIFAQRLSGFRAGSEIRTAAETTPVLQPYTLSWHKVCSTSPPWTTRSADPSSPTCMR